MQFKMVKYFILLLGISLILSCSHSIKVTRSPNDTKSDFALGQKDSSTFSENDIQEEMKFSTADKIASIVGGSVVGFGLGIMPGLIVGGTIVRPKEGEGEGLALVPFAYVGGGVGAICGSILLYKINKDIARKEAIERLLEKKSKEEPKNADK